MDRKRSTINFRDLLGFALLAALLLLGLLSSWRLTRQQEAIAAQLEDSAWLALSGQWENARKGAQEAQKSWDRQRKLWAVVADQSPMEEIDAGFSRLSIYAAARETTEFSAACAALARHMEAMGEAQRLRWQNLL